MIQICFKVHLSIDTNEKQKANDNENIFLNAEIKTRLH